METKKSVRDLNPIPLFASPSPRPLTVAKGKLVLKLRTMALAEELADIPDSIKELHEIVLQSRQAKHEAVYRGILAYLKMLREDSKFYQKFGFGTVNEYNLIYGAGSGESLGKLITTVELFERETFVLVGDYQLHEMIREIRTAQEDHEVSGKAALKRDIQRVFDRYCERYEKFDRTAFRTVVREYLKEQYPPKPRPKPTPAPTPASPLPPQEITISGEGKEKITPPTISAPHVRLKPATQSTAALTPGSPDQVSGYRLVAVEQCSGCQQREIIIRQLVKIIKHLNGGHLLPQIKVPHSLRASWDNMIKS